MSFFLNFIYIQQIVQAQNYFIVTVSICIDKRRTFANFSTSNRIEVNQQGTNEFIFATNIEKFYFVSRFYYIN